MGVSTLLQELGSEEEKKLHLGCSCDRRVTWVAPEAFVCFFFPRDAYVTFGHFLLMYSGAPEHFSSSNLCIYGSSFMDSDDQGSPTAEPYLGKRCEEGNVP